MKKKIFTYSLFAASVFSADDNALKAQQRIVEENADYVMRIQLHKLEADEKKDKYLMEITLANKRDYDLYYAVAKPANGVPINTALGTIKVQNATGLVKSTGFSGILTRLETTNNESLVFIEKNKMLQGQFKFAVPAGAEPLVTFTGNTTFRKLEAFSLRLNAMIVDGTWNSNCLSAASTLSYIDTGSVHYLLQGLNGKYIKWVKQSENTFVRSESQGTILTYSLSTGQFTYTNNDGVYCVWRREN
jgi:hypothetical protein